MSTYTTPIPAALVSDSAREAATRRRKLVPLWIKIFGWIFMVMGAAVPVLMLAAPFLNQPATFEMFGLRHQGSAFHPMALLIGAIILSLAVSAYGLVFGKPWGLSACFITGYGGVAICLATMAYALAAQGALSIRLELLVQAAYLVKLHKIRPLWLSAPSSSASA